MSIPVRIRVFGSTCLLLSTRINGSCGPLTLQENQCLRAIEEANIDGLRIHHAADPTTGHDGELHGSCSPTSFEQGSTDVQSNEQMIADMVTPGARSSTASTSGHTGAISPVLGGREDGNGETTVPPPGDLDSTPDQARDLDTAQSLDSATSGSESPSNSILESVLKAGEGPNTKPGTTPGKEEPGDASVKNSISKWVPTPISTRDQVGGKLQDDGDEPEATLAQSANPESSDDVLPQTTTIGGSDGISPNAADVTMGKMDEGHTTRGSEATPGQHARFEDSEGKPESTSTSGSQSPSSVRQAGVGGKMGEAPTAAKTDALEKATHHSKPANSKDVPGRDTSPEKASASPSRAGAGKIGSTNDDTIAGTAGDDAKPGPPSPQQHDQHEQEQPRVAEAKTNEAQGGGRDQASSATTRLQEAAQGGGRAQASSASTRLQEAAQGGGRAQASSATTRLQEAAQGASPNAPNSSPSSSPASPSTSVTKPPEPDYILGDSDAILYF
eukprot:scaffold451_cov365-Prasinococcus_capsulatus_cf.AAC.9